MSNYSTIEPTVIDEEILRKAVNDQVSPEIADVARREGIEFASVWALRLDYKNILKIDNLWAFEMLTKLQLDNNIIERIENIGFLVNLQWLDLSFNNITVIEGLEGLTKLTDLTLFNNRISKIENLDDLVNLSVLSVGNNNLTVLEDLSYLSKFGHLKVLNASGNAICKSQHYRHYLLAHLRKIKFLDYRLVDKESVDAARAAYLDDLIALEEEEKASNDRSTDASKQALKKVLDESAHIAGLDSLFQTMFSQDLEFQRIFPLDRNGILELRDSEYRSRCDPIIEDLRKFALRRFVEQRNEISAFGGCKRECVASHDSVCIKLYDSYQHIKKQLVRTIHANKEVDVDDCLKRLKDNTQELSDLLMGHEMQIVEQFEDLTKEFERTYTELSATITELSQTSFARLRELENEFHEKFSEAVLASFDRFNKGDLDDVEDELRDLLSDKDVLLNAVNTSHDFRLGRLDHQEDCLVSGAVRSLESVLASMHDKEVGRSRARLCEIIVMLDKCNAEIESIEATF